MTHQPGAELYFATKIRQHGAVPDGEGMSDAKAEKRWGPGVYVGKDEESDEFLYLTSEGMKTARTAQRKPLDFSSHPAI